MNIDFASIIAAGAGTFTAAKLLPALLVLIICLAAVKFVSGIFDRFLEKSPIERSLHTFLRSAVRTALYFLTILIVADKLGIPMTSLIALLSVFGLAVSLAVQGTLSNLAGGIMLLLSQPFKVGDYVEAGSVSGTVEEIGLVYTKVVTADNKVVFCPNSDISGSRIVNYTAKNSRRVDITVGASYDCSCSAVKAAMAKSIRRFNDDILKEKEPFIAVSAYKDSCIEYVLKVWVATERYWDVYYGITEALREEFDAAGIEMTYPHLNVHIVEK